MTVTPKDWAAVLVLALLSAPAAVFVGWWALLLGVGYVLGYLDARNPGA